jgi:hypothetical protein
VTVAAEGASPSSHWGLANQRRATHRFSLRTTLIAGLCCTSGSRLSEKASPWCQPGEVMRDSGRGGRLPQLTLRARQSAPCNQHHATHPSSLRATQIAGFFCAVPPIHPHPTLPPSIRTTQFAVLFCADGSRLAGKASPWCQSARGGRVWQWARRGTPPAHTGGSPISAVPPIHPLSEPRKLRDFAGRTARVCRKRRAPGVSQGRWCVTVGAEGASTSSHWARQTVAGDFRHPGRRRAT